MAEVLMGGLLHPMVLSAQRCATADSGGRRLLLREPSPMLSRNGWLTFACAKARFRPRFGAGLDRERPVESAVCSTAREVGLAPPSWRRGTAAYDERVG